MTDPVSLNGTLEDFMFWTGVLSFVFGFLLGAIFGLAVAKETDTSDTDEATEL